jgi:hypothetical protein
MPTGSSVREARTAQGAAIISGAHGTSRQFRAERRRRRLVTLYVVGGLLRDPHVREGLLIGAITLGALAHLAREKAARDRARLAAWWTALPAPGPSSS